MDDVCEGKDFSFPAQEDPICSLTPSTSSSAARRAARSSYSTMARPSPPVYPTTGTSSRGTIKDVVTRHQSMRGRHVSRRFGWDCHVLPVEFEIDKALSITNRQQVLDLGIAKYNETCRSIVKVRRRVGDHEPQLHGERLVGVCAALGEGPRLQGFQVGRVGLGVFGVQMLLIVARWSSQLPSVSNVQVEPIVVNIDKLDLVLVEKDDSENLSRPSSN